MTRINKTGYCILNIIKFFMMHTKWYDITLAKIWIICNKEKYFLFLHLKIKNLRQKDNQFSDRDSPVSNLLSVSVSLMKEGLMEWKKKWEQRTNKQRKREGDHYKRNNNWVSKMIGYHYFNYKFVMLINS